jgi:hypothetical protein
MAVVSDVEVAFAKRAAADGILFEPMTFDWASEPGPIGIAELADETGDMDTMRRAEIGVPAIEQIFKRLNGLQPVLESGRVEKGFTAVLVHEPTDTIVEVDEVLHFTSHRLRTLELYPPEMKLGFDLKEYKALCEEHGPTSDRWRYGLASKLFGWHGLQKERAWEDAVRDVGAWVMGHPPLIRVPAIDGDGDAAYERVRDKLQQLKG